MTPFKNKLDEMMGDTTNQETRIKQAVHEKMTKKQRSFNWGIPAVSICVAAVALFLFISYNPFSNDLTANVPNAPYDPLDDLAAISTAHQKGELSQIDDEFFASLPVVETISALQYVDVKPLLLNGMTFYPVIERQKNIFDGQVYTAGEIVRTLQNAASDLPTFADTYYTVVAVPGDDVKLLNGELFVNGQKSDAQILTQYSELAVDLRGMYNQTLNAREYLLVNAFPKENSVQGATITPVHKITGEVVALANEQSTNTIYFATNEVLANEVEAAYTPEQFYDLYLVHAQFGERAVADKLLAEGATDPYMNRLGELLLEASYRTITYLSNEEVEIRYNYGREGIGEYTITLVLDANSGIWYVQ